ncbi:methylenetetrahydrofolate reductase [Propionispira raffinosivorans]|uniref:methylenetetrahydrofolate reductase n=1 Tax=Propionispira raffinosivorans TaxID=86959 RepID=UPI00037D7768|nr:methylenetetrahydrofolate reductase [Propionispira raffinosivorans]
MPRISIELVPRGEAAIREELELLKNNFTCIDLINVPELLRYELHSWEGATVAKEFYREAMPHIRAIDIDLDKPLPMASYLVEHKISEVLVITGDPPQDMGRTIYPTVSTDVIRKFRDELPHIKVYAGLDQYRSSMRQEEYNIRRKIQAGAAGFFTQPFFDLRYLEIYAEILAGVEVYWGVSPVLSERSVNYWESKNNVIFPKAFQPTLEWNIDFARQALDFVKKQDANIYLMPIKTNLLPYLSGAFAK